MPRLIRPLALVLFAAAATGFVGSRIAARDAAAAVLAAPAAASQARTFAAVIIGPSNLRVWTQCSWYVNLSGGTPPYSFSWSVTNGSGSGSDNTWYGEFYGSGRLYVTVTDYNNQQVSVSKPVNATAGGPICP